MMGEGRKERKEAKKSEPLARNILKTFPDLRFLIFVARGKGMPRASAHSQIDTADNSDF